MPDGNEADVLTAPETAGATEQQAETELQTEQEQPEAETPEDDTDEVEHEGQKYRVPKALKGGFMMNADYTRKTQELAEARRGFDSERDTFAKSSREHMTNVGRLAVFDETLEAYAKIDWAAFRAQDPDKANATFQDYIQLRDQRATLADKVQKAQDEQSRTQQGDLAKRAADTEAVLKRDIKGWNQDTANKVQKFAVDSGITQDQFLQIATTPALAKLLHQAWLGAELVKKQEAAARKAAAADTGDKPEAQPLKTVGSKPSGAARPGLHDDLSADEWIKRRNDQVRKRA